MDQYLKMRKFEKKIESYLENTNTKPKSMFKGLLAPQKNKAQKDMKKSDNYMEKIGGYMSDIRAKRMELRNETKS
jgi:hypothetical protein